MSVGESGIQKHPQRPRVLVVALAVMVVSLIALSVILVVLYTDPLKSLERTEINWFGATFTTQSESGNGPPFLIQTAMLSTDICQPLGAIGNETVSFIWHSTSDNTSAMLVWAPGGGGFPNSTVDHFFLSNDSRSGGYTIPPDLAKSFCSFPPMYLRWVTPVAASIALSGFQAYNYTATEPIW